MPTVTVVNIIPRKLAENVQTTQYTANNCTTLIDKFTVTNTSVSNVVFSANLVASGGVAGVSNLVISARAIAPSEAYECPALIGQTLESGGFVSTLAGTVGALVISATGREITA